MKYIIAAIVQIIFFAFAISSVYAQKPPAPPVLPKEAKPDSVGYTVNRSFSRIPNDYRLRFKAGDVNLAEGASPGLSQKINEMKSKALSPDTILYLLVQYKQVPNAQEAEQLKNLGAKELGYIPYGGFFISITFGSMDELIKLPIVRSISDIKPEWKISPYLKKKMDKDRLDIYNKVTVVLFQDVISIINTYKLAPAGKLAYEALLNKQQIMELLNLDEVKWIELKPDIKPALPESVPVTGADDAWWWGNTGSGTKVAVIDSGIQRFHQHFNSVNREYAKDWVQGDNSPDDEIGHGTSVAGIIAGNSIYQGRNLLGAASASLVISRIPFPKYNETWEPQQPHPEWAAVFDDVVNRGASIINGSWGHVSTGAYDRTAKDVDSYSKDHPQVLFVFANGNFDDETYMISPALAKNVLAVGATEDGSTNEFMARPVNYASAPYVDRVSLLNNLVSPEDWRTKPDIVAPGQWITTATMGYSYITGHGTSFAAPHVAGLAAIYRQTWVNWGRTPSASEIKAAIIHSTNDLAGKANQTPYPKGHGRPNAIYMLSNYYSLSYFQTWYANDTVYDIWPWPSEKIYTVNVPSNATKLLATLVYTDMPGDENANPALVNDLDLTLESPTGATYAWTLSRIDNVEKVIVNNPAAGTWTIKVTMINLPGDLNISQDYSLFYTYQTGVPALQDNTPATILTNANTDFEIPITITANNSLVYGSYMTVQSTSPYVSQTYGESGYIIGDMLPDENYYIVPKFRISGGSGNYIGSIKVDIGSTNAGILSTRNISIYTPFINYSPMTAKNFTAIQGGANPPPQYLDIWNNSNGTTLYWTASVRNSSTWLALDPVSGSSTGTNDVTTITVSVNVSSLAPGSYSDYIDINATGAANTPRTVMVILMVLPQPAIGFSPSSFNFNAVKNWGNPSNQTLDIWNSGPSGAATLNWTVSDNANWLMLNPTSGISTSQTDIKQVTLTADISNINPGNYSATMTISDPNASNTPQTVPVYLTLLPQPVISISSPSFNFGANKNGSAPNQILEVWNSGIENGLVATMNWTATYSLNNNASWFSLTPAIGYSLGEHDSITLSVNTNSLSAGSYYATIVITASGAANTPVNIPVNFTIWPILGQPYVIATFLQGWNMFSYPLEPDPSSNIGQFADDISGNISVYHYDPVSRQYVTSFPATPGWGYWIKLTADREIDTEGTLVATSSTFNMALGRGWNQIGYPFTTTVAWGNAAIQSGSNIKRIANAHAAGWINETIYSYNPRTRAYEGQKASTGYLNPSVGYWLNDKIDGAILLLPPTPGYVISETESMGGMPRTFSGQESGAWSARLLASNAYAFDDAFAQVASEASLQYDLNDSPEPPTPPELPYIQVYFPHGDWPQFPDIYNIDARPEAASITWNFEVYSKFASPATITLTWDVSQVPGAYKTVQLQDGATGQRLVADMRSATSYWYIPASATYTKSFNFVVDIRSERVTTLYYRNNMFSIPLDTVPADFQAQFGDDVTQDELNSIARFNTYLNQYEYWADLHYPPVIGTGYWITLDANKEVDSWGSLAASANFTIHLVKGRSKWNLIGHPFDFTVNWADAMIYNPATQETVSTTEAASRGWIGQYLYYWNPSTNMYNSTTELWPWYGYWVIANIFCDLIIPPTPAGQGLRGMAGGTPVPTGDKNIPLPPAPPPPRIKR